MALSALFYFFHYLIFRDSHHIFLYLLGDVAFVFIEVLLVTLIIHRLLEERQRQARLEKLNMVIGAFFSEVGTRLLATLAGQDADLGQVQSDLLVSSTWSADEFSTISRNLRKHTFDITIHKEQLQKLRRFLVEKSDFLLRLLENPNLLEHESFTELLRAVFHLTEELRARDDLLQLPPSDYGHLSNDMKRAYGMLVHEWLDYMRYLKDSYPYLFSLALRTNPFDPKASPVVQ